MKLRTVFKLKAKLRDPQLTKIGVIIYMSPQSLSGKNGKALILFLIRNDLIRLIVVDEIHLATSFGNTFRKEFMDLPSLLFSRVTCPMLFLTATCTSAIRDDFKDLMDIDMNSMNWPTANEMAHRCVSIETIYTTKPFQHVMKSFKDMISNSDDGLPSKVIVYSNTRERILNFADSIKKKMNSDSIMKEIDIISLVGTLTKQEKAKYIRLFVNGSTKHPQLKIRVLCATSGVGNAGIDYLDVRAVYRIVFPPSIIDLAQEKGRAGRRPGSSSTDYHYIVCYSLETYLYLFKRILDPTEEYVNDSYHKKQIANLIQVAKVLLTPYTCIPHSLENLMGDPYCVDDHVTLFCGACTNCSTQKKSQFEPPFSRDGINKILLDLFISSTEERILTMENIVLFIMNYPNS